MKTCLQILLGMLLATALPARAVLKNPWLELGQLQPSATAGEPWGSPTRYRALALDVSLLQSLLAQAPLESQQSVAQSAVELPLPLPDGGYAVFRIVESPIMEPELAAKFPEMKTYAGQSLEDPSTTVRLGWTPLGFHAQVLSPSGAVYVDPAYRNDVTQYICYARRDRGRAPGDFTCLATSDPTAVPSGGSAFANRTSGPTLRTYRLACAATGEYTAYFGGTVALGMAAIVAAVNRVDGVYETELAIRLVLVANNNLIVYTSASGDPYSNADGNAMLTQNQANLTSVIGSANYDIGHVFSTGGGGIANLGCVCASTRKAQGVTGSSAPTGDSFWIDYVAHEMGHQFGANHTFNSTTSNCGGGNRNSSTAHEPGSGSTIMAYAGICGADDLQPHSDAYFHATSFDEIVAYTTTSTGNSCPVATATGNTAPTVSAGAAYTIPSRTPFTLTATGSDANGDALTYCWEELDLGAATTLSAADNGSSPLFRSFNPTTNASRTFPKWADILANVSTTSEKLPTTNRTMKFRVTGRDGRMGGGGVNIADTTVTSVSTAGPFLVTAPNTSATQSGALTVTWNVANTTNSPINAAAVNIRLSTNGGASFPILLASNTPNDGVETVVLPNLTTSSARIMVAATGNIFFDVSNANFGIVPGSAVANPVLDSVVLVAESCGPGNGVVDPGETVTVNCTLRNAGTLATTNLVATLLATNGVTPVGPTQTYGALAAAASVSRPFTFTASGVCGSSITTTFQLQDGPNNYGTVTAVFPLGAMTATTISFTNPASIAVPASGTSGSGSPYPSTIAVAGFAGSLSKATVTLRGFTHTYPDDVDILLVGPSGQGVVLMSDCGGGNAASGLTLTFDDAAAATLPDSSALSSGVWHASNVGTGDAFNSPAPSGTFGTNLSAFSGTNPNGTWSLYVLDDATTDIGSIAGGWILNLTGSNLVCCVGSPDLAVGGTLTPNAINLGDSVTVALTLTNLGTATAQSVMLTNALPAGLTLVSANSSQGTITTDGPQVVANFGSLVSGSVATLTLSARGQAPGNWTNIASAGCLGSEASTANNQIAPALFINAPPVLVPINDLAVHAQMQVRFTNQATDADLPLQSLQFSLEPGAPAGAAVGGSTGIFTWTPSDAQIGTYPLTVRVSDNFAAPATTAGSFKLTVLPRPRIGVVTVSGGSVTLTWPAIPKGIYQPQFKDDLAQAAWTNFGPEVTAAGEVLTLTDTVPPGGQRFYRVLVK